jgi:Ca2+-transporting ATPase
MGINVLMVGLQVLIIFVGGAAFSVERLDGRGWGYSLAFGFLSIPVGAAIRCIPDELIRKLIPDYFIRRANRAPQVLVEDEEAQFTFPKPLADVKEELSFLKKVKGGRINNLKFRVEQAKDTLISRSRSGSRSRSSSIPGTPVEPTAADGENPPPAPTPESARRSRGRSNRSRSNSALGATAVMAGIIAGSVAGWSPVERGPNQDPGFGGGREALESRAGVEIHPGTDPKDNIIVEEPMDGPPSQRDDIGPAKVQPQNADTKASEDVQKMEEVRDKEMKAAKKGKDDEHNDKK